MTAPDGTGRIILDHVDSTNAEALRRAGSGAALPLWVMARRQSAGRGRRGRGWAMPEGNLAASLVMPAPPAPLAALRSFTAALAVHDACVAAGVPARRLALKWPNDVLLDGGKLAGILLESDGRHLVVGIGVNLAAHPPAEALEAGALAPARLADAVPAPAPEAFLDRLAAAFAAREAQLAGQGFAPVRAAWLARAARLGETVTARMPGASVSGRFAGLDDSGALLLDTPGGRRLIAAAEIHFA
ncbi:MAG: biotin--[acetyl-CoA-carboxylase] ligase [Alphaproteobacteria bacterium]|nr:MAG: biotin--[acetyl-CoA-carboxylase] ligase [Alphaproteobacteria bacterium]